MATELDRELTTFDGHRNELLGRAKGRFVLIKGDQIIGDYANIQDALSQGYDCFGNQPFLVKQVVDVEVPQNYTSFQIAL